MKEQPDYMYCMTLCKGHNKNCGAYVQRTYGYECIYKELTRPGLTDKELSRIEKILEGEKKNE